MKTMAFERSFAIGIIILFACVLVVPGVAQGTIIYVDDDNTSGPWDGTLAHPYQFIQDGVDSAIAGDTVYVFNGTYYENVEVGKTLTLMGEHKDSTVIDASGLYVDIFSNRVNFTGFTVQNSSTYGIYVRSDSNAIVNNIVKTGSYAGIYLFGGSYCLVSGNTVLGPAGGVGIKERYGSNNTVVENFVDTYYYGISSELEASNSLISGNTVVNCLGPGINLYGALNHTIIDNNFMSGGITVEGDQLSYWNTHTIENNYANGKPIYYFKNDSSAVAVPSDAGQVILANCSNFTIQNLTLSDVDNAIQLGFSSYNNITENTLENNSIGGLFLSQSTNNNVIGNTITNNYEWGIRLEGDSCILNTISDNTITDNGFFGIYTISSSNNIIYHNNLIDNSLYNALAPGTNVWDDGYPSGGNYWSDFDEPGEGAYDNNGDGIVDSAYILSGTSQDRFPLMNPWDGTPPTPPCGDASGDGIVNIADIVYLVNDLWKDGPQPWPATCIGDVNKDGTINSADIIYLLNYLFALGPLPHPDCCDISK